MERDFLSVTIDAERIITSRSMKEEDVQSRYSCDHERHQEMKRKETC